MSQNNHDRIHEAVPIVPLLGHHTLMNVSHIWTPEGETIEDIDNLCLAIEEASTPNRVHSLEKNLAELVIEALQIEKHVLIETQVEPLVAR